MIDDHDENVETCIECGVEWFNCSCLECDCKPEDTVARGGICETCGGDL